MIMRFRMSGRDFTYDTAAPVSGLDLHALHEAGVDPDEAARLLSDAAAGKTAAGITAMRALCVLAYLAATRAGSTESWREFAATVHPATFEPLDPDEGSSGRREEVTGADDEVIDRVLARLRENKIAS